MKDTVEQRICFKKYDKIVPLKDLKKSRYQRNKHPKDQIERLAKLMAKNGVRQAIHISSQTGEVCFGHGRWEAALINGWKTFPVIYQDFKDEQEEYACVQSDNAIAHWAELDLPAINEDVLKLKDFDIDLLGIKDFEAVDPKKAGLCDEDEVPEPTESTAKLGDRWTLGDHVLMCGDSTDVCAVDLLMMGEKAHMVFTDPPYGMNVVKPDGNIGGNRSGKGQYGKEAKCGIYKPIIGDDKPFEPGLALTIADFQIIWGANHFSDKLPTSPHWIVWNKEMPEGTDFSGAELAWTNIDKKAVKVYKFAWAGMTREGNRKDELTKRVHPTQKPVGLFEAILNDYDPKSVIDLYGGSGSTLIACEKTNRKCFMMEIDPHYVDVIIARWEKYTGKKAKLTGNKDVNNDTPQLKKEPKEGAVVTGPIGKSKRASKVIRRGKKADDANQTRGRKASKSGVRNDASRNEAKVR